MEEEKDKGKEVSREEVKEGVEMNMIGVVPDGVRKMVRGMSRKDKIEGKGKMIWGMVHE